jgi:glycerol-3-phosphate cytidylyltransferase
MKKYKIGYTNGVFDLFHAGHLKFLIQCKELCNHLIVAVCEDELVYEHKGKYPVISLSDRMFIINNISCVDKVVVQSTTNRIEEWKKYNYDVFFHGEDGNQWDIDQGYYYALKELGVEPLYFARNNNISTTDIIVKIREQYENE